MLERKHKKYFISTEIH